MPIRRRKFRRYELQPVFRDTPLEPTIPEPVDEVEECHRLLDQFGVPRVVGGKMKYALHERLQMLLDMEGNLSEMRTS